MIVMSCGPTTGCGKLFPNNLPNCPHCGKVNFVQQYTVTVAAPPASASTASHRCTNSVGDSCERLVCEEGCQYAHLASPSPTPASEARKPLMDVADMRKLVESMGFEWNDGWKIDGEVNRFAQLLAEVWNLASIQHPADGAEGKA